MEPTSIIATINYWRPPPPGEAEQPFGVTTAGHRRRKYNPQPTKIYNLRGREHEFDLDKNGFQFVTDCPSRERRWDDEARMREHVYPEIDALLKKVTGATHCYSMGHVIRRFSIADGLAAQEGKADNEIVTLTTPATVANVDQSYNGAKYVLDNIISTLPDRAVAADLAAKAKGNNRWATINAWRPLGLVTREPLAVCDAASMEESDLRAAPVQHNNPTVADGDANPPQCKDEKWQVAANPQQKWYWPNAMTEREVLLVKCFDSRRDGRARRTPHSTIQTLGDCRPVRERIEVRWLVFWEGVDAEGGDEGVRG